MHRAEPLVRVSRLAFGRGGARVVAPGERARRVAAQRNDPPPISTDIPNSFDALIPREVLLEAPQARRHRRVSLALAAHMTAAINASRHRVARSRATRLLFEARYVGAPLPSG